MEQTDPGTIANIAARLALWGTRASKGLARVEFSSDFSRRKVDALVRDACDAKRVPFYSIELPQDTPAPEIVTYLKEQMSPLSHGLVSITGWETAFPPAVDLLDSLRVLNYNRENLAQFPLCQIWWMTGPFTDAVIQNIPDLASWFIVRLTLQENLAPPREETRGPTVPLASPEQQAAARNRSADIVERVHNALHQDASLPELSDLADDAVNELRDVGLGQESHILSEDLLTRLLTSAPYQEYLSGTLAIREKDEIRLLQNLANLYEAHRNIHNAEEALDKALKLAEKVFGPESNEVSFLLNQLASLYHGEARYGEAEPLYRRSLAIMESFVGREHPAVATRLNNLADLYSEQGQYSKAEPLFKSSLAIREKSLGPEHSSVATSLNNLAELYRIQGRYAQAEPLFKRALAIMQKALGQEHPNMASNLSNLALLYIRQRQYAKAEPLLKSSLAIREKVLGPEHPDTANSLNNLAGLYYRQGRFSEAEPLFKRSLEIREKALELDHPIVANSLHNLAGLYEDQGCYAQAEPLLKRSLAIYEKALGPVHPDTIIVMENYARCLGRMGRNGEARMLMAQAEGRKKRAAARNKK